MEQINLTPAEIQSGFTRSEWAEKLLLQIPETHEGRNSWLMNYGVSLEAVEIRARHQKENPDGCFSWNQQTQAWVWNKKYELTKKKKPKSAYRLLQTASNCITIMDSQQLTIAEITREDDFVDSPDVCPVWRIARMLEMAPAMQEIFETFVKRCESGEYRSKRTYASMKEILDYIKQ